MSKHALVEKYYPEFINFLLSQKKSVINSGSKYDLTPMQSLAIMMLIEPMPMNQMTHAFNCDASNITGIVDGLQSKGLANRYENKNDRRIRMVKLKTKGLEIHENLLHDLLSDDNPLISKLTLKELETFFSLICKITQD